MRHFDKETNTFTVVAKSTLIKRPKVTERMIKKIMFGFSMVTTKRQTITNSSERVIWSIPRQGKGTFSSLFP